MCRITSDLFGKSCGNRLMDFLLRPRVWHGVKCGILELRVRGHKAKPMSGLIDGLDTGVKFDVGCSMFRWADARGFPSAKGEVDVRIRGGLVQFEDS